MDNAKDKLVSIIVEQTGWGAVAGWQGGDFRRLSAMIFEKTRINLSESTLRRVMGKAEYPHLPSETTLNTLAVFAGYESWRAFGKQVEVKTGKPAFKAKPIIYACLLIALIALTTGAYHYFYAESPAGFAYVFTSRPVARTVPNSVIFNYKVGKTSKPVYIQQSWDDRTRAKVAADGNTFASVYYKPGFYEAKLLVGDKIVKEHPLIIHTTGWLGLLNRPPVPVYLAANEFTKPDRLEVDASAFTAHQVKTEPEPVRAELYNVGNFTPVAAGDASFSALIKCNDERGAAVCGKGLAFLITNGIPLSIPICAKGCVATIGLFNGRQVISGKAADLSGFGAEVSSWVKVEYRVNGGKLQLMVNGKIAYQGPLPPAGLKILGIAFGFENGGAVKNIQLQARGEIVFKAY
jgi:hypothetical protein